MLTNADLSWAIAYEGYQKIIHLSQRKDEWSGGAVRRYCRQQIDIALRVYDAAGKYAIAHNIDFATFEPLVGECANGDIMFQWTRQRMKSTKFLSLYVIPNERTILGYMLRDFPTVIGYSRFSPDLGLDENYVDVSHLFPYFDWMISKEPDSDRSD